MVKKNISYESISHTIDADTGEVISVSSVQKYKVENEPEYIKMYIHDIIRLKDIPNGMKDIFLAFVRNMSYSNVIPTYKPIKQMLSNDLGVSISYIDNAITEFYKKGLFIRIARGMYMADPNLFAKGKWEDIKQLRLVIEYDQGSKQKKLKSNLPEEVQLKLGF